MDLTGLKEKRDLLSLLVATVAVVLSQFPPVYQWFYSSELEFRIEPSSMITPNAYSGLSISRYHSITNTGDKSGRVKALYLFIVDTTGSILYEARAQGYRLHGLGGFGQAQWEQFSEINLGPGENWAHQVSFNRMQSNRELDEMREIRMRIEDKETRWELVMEEQGYDMDDIDAPLFELNGPLLDELMAVVSRKTGWFGEGEYAIFDAFITDSGAKVFGYDVGVSGSHVRSFARSLEGLSYGLDYNTFTPSVMLEGSVSSDVVPQSVIDRVEFIENRYGFAGDF